MTFSLFISAITKFALGVVLVGVFLFVPAGSFLFWQGWLMIGVVFIPMLIAGIVMMLANPQLLSRRLDAKEKEKDQSLVVKLSATMFVMGFVVAGLGYRFRWYALPAWVSIGASVLFLIGYILYAEVLRENTYLSRTIEVQQGQTVVESGLYGKIRHPMYAATLLLFLPMPLILGSVYAVPIFLAYPMIIVKRIHGEEAVLAENLVGYREYMQKVKYRLIPMVW